MKDIRTILENCSVPYKDSGKDWINVCCPFCGDTKFHLGYNAQFGVFSCYRCGRHSFFETMSSLIGKDVVLENLKNIHKYAKREPKRQNHPTVLQYPEGTYALNKKHCQYLRKRNFIPSKLQSVWGLLGTGNEGKYANRIVIPVVFKKHAVSFMARDITGDSPAKMLFCEPEKEVVPAKNLLHGYDFALDNWILVTEGPFDTFRFGPGAVDTMGINFTESQVSLLKGFANIFILFDSCIDYNGFETEKQAQEQAEKLADCLSPFCNVWILNEFKSDLGDMNDFQVLKIKQTIKNALLEQRRKQNV